MKLLYFTPNGRNISSYISRILANKYGLDDISEHDNRSYRHLLLIVEIPKREDEYLSTELLQIMNIKSPHRQYIKLVETDNHYYMSVTVGAYEDIIQMAETNDIAYQLSRLSQTTRFINARKDPISGGEWKSKDTEFHYQSNFAHSILNDMRTLGRDFLAALSASELTREELSYLFSVTIQLKVPQYVYRDLVLDGYNVVANDYCTHQGIRFESDDTFNTETPTTLRLSDLTPDANLDSDRVQMDVNTNRLLRFITRFVRSRKRSKAVLNAILPSSVMVDAFISISFSEMAELFEYHAEPPAKTYTKTISDLVWTMLRIDSNMSYIILGDDRR